MTFLEKVCVCVLVAQLCPTLSKPMDCSPPGSSDHGILQVRVLEWGAIAFSGTMGILVVLIDLDHVCVSRSVVSDSLQPHGL